MPRYFFHLTDGKKVVTEHEPEGIDCAGDAAASEEAMILARAIKYRGLMPGRDWDDWFVKIVDQQGREVEVIPIAQVPDA
jgi:hypothetical protein